MSSGNFDSREGMHSSEKAYSGGKIQDPQKSSSLGKVESTEFLFLGLNPSFNRQDSLTSGHVVVPSTSGIYSKEICSKHKPVSETVMMDDPVFMNLRNSDKFSRLFRESKTRTRYDDSVENLVLKKTEETINFSVQNFGSEATDNMQCAAERLRLGDYRKSSGEVTTRSDYFFSDNLLNELNADSQGEECLSPENISQTYIPFQTKDSAIRGSDTLITEIKGENKLQDFWSFRKNWLLNKPQIVAFFGKTKRKKKKKRKERDTKKDSLRTFTLAPSVSAEEDLETKLYLRKFYFQILQLLIITGISLIMLTSSMFYLSDFTTKIFMDTTYGPVYDNNSSEAGNRTLDHFPTLRDSRTVDDFWAYAENTLIKLLYWDFYYIKMDAVRLAEFGEKKLNENQILGVTRIRQVRVMKNSCKIHPYVERFFNACYPPYNVLLEDTNPIREDMDGKITATAWKYREAESLHSLYHWGKISIYGGGGYYTDFPQTKEDAVAMIKELRENHWVTKATRAIFIDFTIYNANVNLFCICNILVELPAVGGIIPTASFDSLKIIRYLTGADFFVLGCEFVYIIFIVYDICQMIKDIHNAGVSFLFSAWNYLDIAIILLSVVCFIVSVIRQFETQRLIANITSHQDSFTDLTSVRNLQIALDRTFAMLVFCNWLRLFSYLNFTRRMVQFNRTLKKSLKDMLIFLPMLITMLLAFSTLGYMLFGTKVLYYSTLSQSFLALLQAFLGEFNYYDIFEVNTFLGPIFYILYVFLIFFVMMNMFIAIINDSYMSVMSQVIPRAPRTGEYIKRAFINTFTCFQPRRLKKSPAEAGRKKMLFKDIQSALRRAGFKQEEIQIFFHKYNINYRNFLDEKTKTRIMRDVELKRINLNETSEQFQIYLLRRKLDEFRERIENWEVKLQPVIDKVDILLHRMN